MGPFNDLKTNRFRNGDFPGELLAGNMKRRFGKQQFAIGLQAIMDFTQEPGLVRHFMEHRKDEGEVRLGVDLKSILLAFV